MGRRRRWAYVPLQVKDYALALLGVGLFVAALIAGEVLKSFAFLAAAAWWALLGAYWRRRALRSRRRGRPQTPEERDARRRARELNRASDLPALNTPPPSNEKAAVSGGFK
jgi:hypothetical protein